MPDLLGLIIRIPVTTDFMTLYAGARMDDQGRTVYAPAPINLPVVPLGAGVIDLGRWVIEAIELEHSAIQDHPVIWATLCQLEPAEQRRL